MWLWTPNEDVALNAKWNKTWLQASNWRCGSERQTKKQGSGRRKGNVALNAKWKKVVALMLKWKRGFEHQTEYMALNANIKKDGAIKCQNENTALNAKLKRGGGSERQTKNNQRLWTPNWRCDGSRCQNEKSGYERQTEDEQWLWTLNGKWL